MRSSLILFLCYFTFACDGQPTGEPKEPKEFSASDLQNDLQQLTDLLAAHPALHRFTSKDNFEKLVKKQREKITDSSGLRDFYKICLPIIASVGCGHTTMRAERLLYDHPIRLPFGFFIKEKQMFVTRTNNADVVPLRSKIVSINGQPFDEIYTSLYNGISADGFNHSSRNALLNENFERYYSLYYRTPTKGQVSIQTPDGKTSTVILDATDPDALGHRDNSVYPLNRCEAGVCLKIFKEPRYAVLTLSGFWFYGNRQAEFNKLIDSSFHDIKVQGIDKLIVDIRHNGGGDPFNASYLLSYLSETPLTYFKEATPNYESLMKPVPPARERFSGKVILVTDGFVFSTAGHLSALVKYHKLATIVGEETGGTYTCNDSSEEYTLKHTGISIRVPQRTFTVDVSGMDFNTGVIPDQVVKWEVDDIIDRKDRLMERAVEMITR